MRYRRDVRCGEHATLLDLFGWRHFYPCFRICRRSCARSYRRARLRGGGRWFGLGFWMR